MKLSCQVAPCTELCRLKRFSHKDCSWERICSLLNALAERPRVLLSCAQTGKNVHIQELYLCRERVSCVFEGRK